MWTSPRYRELTGKEPPSTTPSATDDAGLRLVTLDRQSREGPPSELRVTVAEYQGHKFLSLRVWIQNAQTGVWYPAKDKGVSVRLKEAEAVAEAIKRGLRIAEGDSDPATPRGRGPVRREAPGQQRLIERAPGGDQFSEF